MLGCVLFMLGCVQVKEKFACELKPVIVSQQTRQEYRLKASNFLLRHAGQYRALW